MFWTNSCESISNLKVSWSASRILVRSWTSPTKVAEKGWNLCKSLNTKIQFRSTYLNQAGRSPIKPWPAHDSSKVSLTAPGNFEDSMADGEHWWHLGKYLDLRNHLPNHLASCLRTFNCSVNSEFVRNISGNVRLVIGLYITKTVHNISAITNEWWFQKDLELWSITSWQSHKTPNGSWTIQNVFVGKKLKNHKQLSCPFFPWRHSYLPYYLLRMTYDNFDL